MRVWYSPELSSFVLIITRGYFDGVEGEKEDELEKFGGAAGGLPPPVCYMVVVPPGISSGTARTISSVRARDPKSFVPRCGE